MKIGIIGSGNVGGTLGKRWARNGHAVVFSSRHPQSREMQELVQAAGFNAKAGSTTDAVEQSDILLLATPWNATEQALKSAGDLAGKLLIDATNPILPDLSGLALEPNTSAGEKVAQWAAGAKVVKAFNTVGNNIMENPAFSNARPVLLYCGDDKGAKQTVTSLISELGLEPLDAGPITQARVLE